jgi:hypothetical protein
MSEKGACGIPIPHAPFSSVATWLEFRPYRLVDAQLVGVGKNRGLEILRRRNTSHI